MKYEGMRLKSGVGWIGGGAGCSTSLSEGVGREPMWGETLGGGAVSSSGPG